MLLQSLTLLSIVTDLEISRCFKELISHLHILIRITKFDWISRYSEYNHWIQNYLNYSGLNLSILLISLDKEAKIFCLPQCLLNFLTKLFMMPITRNTKDLPIENTLFHHMNLNWAKVFSSSCSFRILPLLSHQGCSPKGRLKRIYSLHTIKSPTIMLAFDVDNFAIEKEIIGKEPIIQTSPKKYR